jgi:hypothetical protein
MKKQGLDVSVSGVTAQVTTLASKADGGGSSSSSSSLTIIIAAAVAGSVGALMAIFLGVYARRRCMVGKVIICRQVKHCIQWYSQETSCMFSSLVDSVIQNELPGICFLMHKGTGVIL